MNKTILKTQKIITAVGVRKTSADQMTPWDLALKMVDEIPAPLFNSQVLIPGAGYGTFARALVYKGWNPAKITCVEIDSAYFIVLRASLKDLGLSLIHADFLTWQSPMKFDVIIGNPPYSLPKKERQNLSNGTVSLALLFTQKAAFLLNDGGFISFITPPNMVKPTDARKTTNRYSYLGGLNLLTVSTDAKQWFPSIGSAIIRWTANKEKDDKTFFFNGQDWDLAMIPFIVNLDSPELVNLFKKIWSHLKSEGRNIEVEQKYMIQVSPGWSCVERVNRGRERDGIINWSPVLKKEKLSNLHVNLEADEANAIFSSPMFRFFTKATYVEPTLYKNLFDGLNIEPLKLSPEEDKMIEEYLAN